MFQGFGSFYLTGMAVCEGRPPHGVFSLYTQWRVEAIPLERRNPRYEMSKGNILGQMSEKQH